VTASDSGVAFERRGEVEWITLDRPDRLNALTPPMVAAIADRFAEMCGDPSVRVVVLRGAGRGFCAGLDIRQHVEAPTASSGMARLPEIVLSMRRCPQPVIALVQGAACGGGFALALAADVRIAGESAQMNDAFVTLGVSGCELGLTYFLPRHVGTSVAAELMYTGRFLDARRAHRLGLVSDVVADGELEAAGEALALEMLRVAPVALRKTKETLTRTVGVDDLATVIDIETAVQQECLQSSDFEEALRAFVEKREPRFTTG
jgi:enoyl-CoA hydratase/carnithine racemase